MPSDFLHCELPIEIHLYLSSVHPTCSPDLHPTHHSAPDYHYRKCVHVNLVFVGMISYRAHENSYTRLGHPSFLIPDLALVRTRLAPYIVVYQFKLSTLPSAMTNISFVWPQYRSIEAYISHPSSSIVSPEFLDSRTTVIAEILRASWHVVCPSTHPTHTMVLYPALRLNTPDCVTRLSRFQIYFIVGSFQLSGCSFSFTGTINLITILKMNHTSMIIIITLVRKP